MGDTLIAMLVGFVVFLALRELMCWYWKINRIVTLLESIERYASHLHKEISKSGYADPTKAPSRQQP